MRGCPYWYPREWRGTSAKQRYLGRSGYVTKPEYALRATAAEPIERGDRGVVEYPPEPEALGAEELAELAAANCDKFERFKRQHIIEQERQALVRGLDREWQRVGSSTGGTIIYGDMRFIRRQSLVGENRGAVLVDLNHQLESAIAADVANLRGSTFHIGDFRRITT